MPELTEFDRVRIQRDIEQLTELIKRKTVMIYWEANETTRTQLQQDITAHTAQLETYNALLA